MPKFWSYITCDKYSIGCTGQSVYVYKNGNEVLCLKGFQYTYKSCISPNLEYFAVKSNTGVMYIYSLKSLTLLKKVRFMKASETQDRMFTFSLTGQEIISIDQYDEFHSCISYYSVPTLELKQRVFDDNNVIEPFALELTDQENVIYTLIQERNKDNIVHKYSIALIKDNEVQKNVYITEKEFDLYSEFIELKSRGFTEKSKECSALKYEGYDISNIENRNYSLANIFKYYTAK